MVRYCPVGDGAFEDWVQKCPECGRALRDVPPDRNAEEVGMDETAGELALLVTAPNEPIAQMWAEDLRAEGIRVLLRAEGPGMGAWGSVATFPHQLYVRGSDLERAQTVLDELAVADDTEPLNGWDDDGEDEEEPRSSS